VGKLEDLDPAFQIRLQSSTILAMLPTPPQPSRTV